MDLGSSGTKLRFMRMPRRALIAAVLALAAGPGPLAAAEENFAAWRAQLAREAVARGIGPDVVARALDGVEPLPAVIEADRRQPERRLSFVDYRRLVVSRSRIATGQRLLQEHQELLSRVERRYGVPAAVIVALWGVESDFGRHHGDYPVFAALATLAYDGRRASLFRAQLLDAFEIVGRGYADIARMRGSWAGAMGQNQFMPSTFLAYAVDFDGDGRRDIWTSLPDIFASTANYLAAVGWDAAGRWGREVRVPGGSLVRSAGLDRSASLATWAKRGVSLADGARLPATGLEASLLLMDEGSGPSFLVYDNFRALMAWNRSTYFGVSVGLLSDSLQDG